MRERAFVHVATRTVAWAVLVVSGAYLMIYLYRWEWNRAVISGIFFLAAEVALLSSSLFVRLSRLECVVGDGDAPPPARPDPGTDVERESPFAWLNPADGRLGVFVPLLMGAGVIVSALAFVVEKVSGAVARTASSRRVEVPVLPASGLLADAPPASALPASATGRKGRPSVRAPFLLVLAAVTAFPAIGLVADATQSRPDPHPDVTTLELEVSVRDQRESATEEAGALWVSCKGRVRLDHVEVTSTDPGRARLVVSGVMGEHARRKFTGCLEDATLDRVQARVISMTSRPAGPPASEG